MSNDRRTFLKTMAAGIVSPAIAAGAVSPTLEAAAQATKTKARPNVLLMICDDLGYGDLGCYGSKIPTPNLDRLAADGMRCMRHNSGHPICSASRASLLTGRYATRSHTKGALFPKQEGMDREEQTMADLFRAGGYMTHCIGKWHLGDIAGHWPTDRGFDSFYGVPYSDDMQPLPLVRGTTPLEADTDRDELTPRYTEEAVKLLNEAGKSPFFLYLAYSYPHDPARGSKAFRGKSNFGDVGDSIEEIDWSVGQLMNTLKSNGQLDNTVVIFTSDHGPWFQGNPGLVRGRKASTFEGGSRVPFLLRWKGHVPSGAVSQEWSNHLNLLPTLSAWCGLQKPKLLLDGVDSSAIFLHSAPAPEKPVIYFSTVGNANIHCIRVGSWKLRVAQSDGQIYINDRPGSTTNYLLPHPELYNLDLDPTEAYDVAKKHPDVVARLREELKSLIPTFPDDVIKAWQEMRGRVCSVTTPPGAVPRIVKGPLPSWAWEPENRRD
ncbi:sulfatase-like hydrolase/transferase [Terriglobus sp. TAA 43]|uniref:sulfatase-like hydrolase/transferase n=1 Tax=Terriglobus sp. TAA 43 TaxID=278961 RepID=UPI00068A96BA|nr:sulfatase-like hydrolase/transferase [Terriglobus sp. TAA 43]